MKNSVLLLMVWCALIFTSCASQRIVYLNDMNPELMYPVDEKAEMVIRPGDRLKIFVSSTNSELTVPFNQEMLMVGKTDGTEISGTGHSDRGREYLVDLKGNIEFPILGLLHVTDITCRELGSFIKDKLTKSNLLDDAVVMVELLNWKVSVLGEVNRVGVIDIQEGQYITLLEAISRTGGLTDYAAEDKVAVIREVNGIRKMFVNDLRSTDLFYSQTYYLQQNDIVYVQPKEAKKTAKEERKWRWYSTGLSAIGLLISIITLTKI